MPSALDTITVCIKQDSSRVEVVRTRVVVWYLLRCYVERTDPWHAKPAKYLGTLLSFFQDVLCDSFLLATLSKFVDATTKDEWVMQ